VLLVWSLPSLAVLFLPASSAASVLEAGMEDVELAERMRRLSAALAVAAAERVRRPPAVAVS